MVVAATGHGGQHGVAPWLPFGEVLAGYHAALFNQWWQDARAYAEREATAGSAFAAQCLRQSASPSAHDSVFHHFSFAHVGRRDAAGQFVKKAGPPPPRSAHSGGARIWAV